MADKIADSNMNDNPAADGESAAHGDAGIAALIAPDELDHAFYPDAGVADPDVGLSHAPVPDLTLTDLMPPTPEFELDDLNRLAIPELGAFALGADGDFQDGPHVPAPDSLSVADLIDDEADTQSGIFADNAGHSGADSGTGGEQEFGFGVFRPLHDVFDDNDGGAPPVA